jgi:hypothetical protein
MKDFTVKAWLKKLAKKKEDIQPKYLMNEQEVAQNEKIERLFFKFDTDGSGALDGNELFELFKENGVEIDAEVINEMFNNQAFTLRNFKDINNSPNALLRFRAIMRQIRNSVKAKNNKVFVPYSFESMMQLFG